MKKKIASVRIALLLICCSNLLFVSRSVSQDFHLSQYDAFAQYLNPAMTGMFNGDYRANVHIRRQWASVIANPYVTTGVGLDMSHFNALKNPKLKQIKIGGYIINQVAGTSKFNIFNFGLSGAYDWAIKRTNNHVSLGLQLGFINNSIILSNLYYGSQYNNQNGGGFSGTSNETFNSKSTTLPDVNLGAMYYYGNVKSRFNPFIGGTILHVTQPKQTFFTDNNKLPMRYNINGGTKINIAKQHQANLYFLIMKQQNVTELDGNIMGMSLLRGRNDVCLLYGFGYRKLNNQDAEVIHMGMKYGNITCRVSYDVNISQLKVYSNGQGGFEISLVYIHSKPVKIPPLTCPRI